MHVRRKFKTFFENTFHPLCLILHGDVLWWACSEHTKHIPGRFWERMSENERPKSGIVSLLGFIQCTAVGKCLGAFLDDFKWHSVLVSNSKPFDQAATPLTTTPVSTSTLLVHMLCIQIIFVLSVTRICISFYTSKTGRCSRSVRACRANQNQPRHGWPLWTQLGLGPWRSHLCGSPPSAATRAPHFRDRCADAVPPGPEMTPQPSSCLFSVFFSTASLRCFSFFWSEFCLPDELVPKNAFLWTLCRTFDIWGVVRWAVHLL